MSTEDSSAQESAAPAVSAEDDPRPVFEGDWNSASGVEKGEHSERVRQWKARHQAAQPDRSADAEVEAILGSGTREARHTPDGAAQILDRIARDPKQPGSARVSAARALVEEEREVERAEAAAQRAAATAALASVPMAARLSLLERIVRRDEAAGWRSVFDSEAAGPADSADPMPDMGQHLAGPQEAVQGA